MFFFQTDLEGLEEAAFSTLEKQRTELCSQAEQLIHKTISLYDIGLSLGILSSNPRLCHHLESASRDFCSLRQNEDAFSEDESEVENTSENGEETSLSSYSQAKASRSKR
jgi:hypothetical protein